jgi:hypothetical protein
MRSRCDCIKPPLALASLLILAACLGAPALAATIIVPDQAPTITDGIAAAVSSDTVLVRPGLYEENLDFGGKEILLLAEQGPEVTTIYGVSDGPTIVIQNEEGRGLIIDGFTITGTCAHYTPGDRRGIEILAGSPTIRNNIIRDNVPTYSFAGPAGGIYATGTSSPWIEGNTITGNNASVTILQNNTGLGGGICLRATAELPIPAVIRGNTVSGNKVSNYDFVVTALGGGIYVETLRPEDCVIEGNTILRNRAVADCEVQGGGIYATCEVQDNWIEQNYCSSSVYTGALGGGLCLAAGAARRNVVIGNHAESSTAYSATAAGGGIAAWGNVVDNVVARNWISAYSPPGGMESMAFGGGIFFLADSLFGNTVVCDSLRVYGSAWPEGTGVYSNGAAVCMANNIIARCHGPSEAISGLPGGLAYACNDVWGNTQRNYPVGYDPTGTNGNISEDPLFCDLALDDFGLLPTSPCAPDHSPSGCGLVGALPVGCSSFILVAPDGSTGYATIQDAIDAAGNGMTIRLLDGTYTGDGNRDLDAQGKTIVIESVSGNAAACRIDCAADPEHPHRAFVFSSAETPGTVVRNLTLAGGSHPDGGGGIFIDNASPTIDGCIITECTTGLRGGGALCVGGGAIFTGCMFLDNQASAGGGGLAAGNSACQIMVNGCTFYANESPEDLGAGIQVESDASFSMDRTIVAFSATGQALHFAGTGPAPTLTCSDLFGNPGGDWVGAFAGQLGVSGNITADPEFCDAAAGDFTIRASSPCAPENNPECGLIGAQPVGCPPIFLVRPDGTGTQATIQDAIDAAGNGVTILLADGVFTGEGNRDVLTYGKALTICSASHDPSACVIDCQATAQELHHAFQIDADIELQDITITGGYYSYGGALSCGGSSPHLVNCVLIGNVATSMGGGVYAYNGASPILQGCTLAGNQAYLGSGACARSNSSLTLDRCIIAGNLIGNAVHCTLQSQASAACCDIWGNAGGDYTGCLEAYAGIEGNISLDPLFCDPQADDFALFDTSPCAPANNPECGQIGALPVLCGTVAVHGPEVSRLALGPLFAWAAPSPALAGVHIAYRIPSHLAGMRLRLAILDAQGRLVRQLVDQPQGAGLFRVDWDRTCASGQPAPAGAYFYRVVCGEEEYRGRLILMR